MSEIKRTGEQSESRPHEAIDDLVQRVAEAVRSMAQDLGAVRALWGGIADFSKDWRERCEPSNYRSDSEIVEDCTEQLMQIAASEAPRMLSRLRAVLLELAHEVEEYKPIDRPLRQHVILDARGKIGRDRVWYAWRRSEIDWLRGVPGECE